MDVTYRLNVGQRITTVTAHIPFARPNSRWLDRRARTQEIGALEFLQDSDTIDWIWVHPNYRRRGVATGMLEQARLLFPDLAHSDNLSEDGMAWANARP